MSFARWAAWMLAAWVIGCSPASMGMDAGPEAAVDAGATCADFCQCEMAACADQIPAGFASCMDWCATFSAMQRDCRALHCGMAASGNRTLHCPHTAGLNGVCE